MKIQFAPLLLLVLLPICVLGQSKPFSGTQLSAQGQKSFQTLLSAEQFEDVIIGGIGKPSELVAAYRVLLEEENCVEAFKDLLDKATPAGQLYALCGLYDTDYKFFLSVVAKYQKRTDSVETLSGCVGVKKLMREVVFLNKPDTVRLSSPSQPFDEWKRKAKIKGNSIYIDIAGGGYPFFFRGGVPLGK